MFPHFHCILDYWGGGGLFPPTQNWKLASYNIFLNQFFRLHYRKTVWLQCSNTHHVSLLFYIFIFIRQTGKSFVTSFSNLCRRHGYEWVIALCSLPPPLSSSLPLTHMHCIAAVQGEAGGHSAFTWAGTYSMWLLHATHTFRCHRWYSSESVENTHGF